VAPLVLLLAVAACSSPDAPAADASAQDDGPPCLFCSDATDDAPLQVQVKGKIDQICSNADGCHGQGAAGMSLLVGTEFDAMIGVPSSERPPMLRVKPGDPLQSYVFLKLWCDGGIDGGCMPLSTGPSPALAQLFHDWIEAGAPTQ
jgi:hypothetical protein